MTRPIDKKFQELSEYEKEILLGLAGSITDAIDLAKNQKRNPKPLSEELFIAADEPATYIHEDDIANALYDARGIQEQAVEFMIDSILKLRKGK